MNCWIIANPKAGSGRARRVAHSLSSELPAAEIRWTECPGDATRIAREARASGVEVVAAVGGDGTIHECVAGLVLDEVGQPVGVPPKLALCPAGTGGDFRKTFGMKDSVEQAASRISSPVIKRVDVGKILYTTHEGTRSSAFINAMSFGLGGLTDRLVQQGPKWLGGRAAFFIGAVRANLAYEPLPIELIVDGKRLEAAPYSNVAVCNGQFFGGGMHIAPPADPSDGYFDVVTMELSKLETMTLTTDIYRGTHLRRERIHHHRCRHLVARTTRDGSCLIDVDGEQLGQLPLEIELLPGALELLT